MSLGGQMDEQKIRDELGSRTLMSQTPRHGRKWNKFFITCVAVLTGFRLSPGTQLQITFKYSYGPAMATSYTPCLRTLASFPISPIK